MSPAESRRPRSLARSHSRSPSAPSLFPGVRVDPESIRFYSTARSTRRDRHPDRSPSRSSKKLKDSGYLGDDDIGAHRDRGSVYEQYLRGTMGGARSSATRRQRRDQDARAPASDLGNTVSLTSMTACKASGRRAAQGSRRGPVHAGGWRRDESAERRDPRHGLHPWIDNNMFARGDHDSRDQCSQWR